MLLAAEGVEGSAGASFAAEDVDGSSDASLAAYGDVSARRAHRLPLKM